MNIKHLYFKIGLLTVFICASCSDSEFAQEKPNSHQMVGFWKSESIPVSLKKRYNLSNSMAFRINQDGSAEFMSLAFIDMNNKFWVIDSLGNWSIRDANPSDNRNKLLKWEILLLFENPNSGICMSVLKKNGNIILRYDWEPDYGEYIIFEKVKLK